MSGPAHRTSQRENNTRIFFLLSARLTETVPEITKSLPVPSSPPAAPPPPSPPLPPQPPGLLPSPSALRASHVNSLHAHILFGAIRKREPFPACHIASCHHQLIHQLPLRWGHKEERVSERSRCLILTEERETDPGQESLTAFSFSCLKVLCLYGRLHPVNSKYRTEAML